MPNVQLAISNPSSGRRRRGGSKKKNARSVINVQSSVAKPKSRARPRRRGPSSRPAPSQYLRSLLDPENNPGAKIPDLINASTGTFQLTFDTVVSQSGSGDGVAFVLTANPLATGQGYTGVNSAAGAAFTYTAFAFPGAAAVANLYEAVRIVSAIVLCEYTGTSLADSGQVVGYQEFRGRSTPTTFGAGQAVAFSKTVPLRQGMTVRYKPYDNVDLEFNTATTANVFNFLVIQTAGMSAGASCRFRAVVNYEGIPISDTSNFVNSAPSPVNLAELSSTAQYLGAEGALAYVQPFINYFSPFSTLGMGAAFAGMSLARQAMTRPGGRAGPGNRFSVGLPEMGMA